MSQNRITINSDIHFGQPCIAGTRIPIYCILELVQAGASFDEIITEYYPDIAIDDIKACIQYAMNLIKFEEIHFGEIAVS